MNINQILFSSYKHEYKQDKRRDLQVNKTLRLKYYNLLVYNEKQ